MKTRQPMIPVSIAAILDAWDSLFVSKTNCFLQIESKFRNRITDTFYITDRFQISSKPHK